MKKILASLIALSLIAGVSASAYAAAPKTKADCEKQHMKWDEGTKTCS